MCTIPPRWVASTLATPHRSAAPGEEAGSPRSCANGGLETFRSSLGKVHLPPDPRQRPDLSFIRRANAYRGVA